MQRFLMWKSVKKIPILIANTRTSPNTAHTANRIPARSSTASGALPSLMCPAYEMLRFGQMSLHLPQEIHSPMRTLSASVSTQTGQLFAHAEQRIRQLSRLRVYRPTTGNSANTAPIGHKNWQKNRSFTAMPTTISASRILPSAYADPHHLSAVSMEKTSHGLQPDRPA